MLETAPIKGTNGEDDAHTNQHNENSLLYLTGPVGSTGTAALFLECSLMWPPVSPSFPSFLCSSTFLRKFKCELAVGLCLVPSLPCQELTQVLVFSPIYKAMEFTVSISPEGWLTVTYGFLGNCSNVDFESLSLSVA